MNLQVDHRGKPTRHVRFQKTGLDYAVSWSVIGLFVILGLTALHLASFVLIPLTLAAVVGLILGAAADRMGTAGIPPMLTVLTRSGLFLAILLFLSSRLTLRPYSRLLRQGRQAEGNPYPECRGSGAGLLFCHRQSVIYALFGIIAALIAWLVQRSSPVLWGVSAFLLSFLPFIGIALVTVAMAVGLYMKACCWVCCRRWSSSRSTASSRTC
ncbi:hypothetical protein GVN24_22925 [Rhizobium sp. CRIBSB]|nr:hypothetical protein [Rhizobium sp. CRIBSB]